MFSKCSHAARFMADRAYSAWKGKGLTRSASERWSRCLWLQPLRLSAAVRLRHVCRDDRGCTDSRLDRSGDADLGWDNACSGRSNRNACMRNRDDVSDPTALEGALTLRGALGRLGLPMGGRRDTQPTRHRLGLDSPLSRRFGVVAGWWAVGLRSQARRPCGRARVARARGLVRPGRRHPRWGWRFLAQDPGSRSHRGGRRLQRPPGLVRFPRGVGGSLGLGPPVGLG